VRVCLVGSCGMSGVGGRGVRCVRRLMRRTENEWFYYLRWVMCVRR